MVHTYYCHYSVSSHYSLVVLIYLRLPLPSIISLFFIRPYLLLPLPSNKFRRYIELYMSNIGRLFGRTSCCTVHRCRGSKLPCQNYWPCISTFSEDMSLLKSVPSRPCVYYTVLCERMIKL